MKTLLIFSDWYVPGYKAGGPIQSIHNLAVLLSEHFIVKVICRDRDLNSNEMYPNISTNTWIKLDSNHFVMYLDENKTKIKHIKNLIHENQNNILYINGLFSFKFSILPIFFSNYLNVKNTFVSVRGMLHRSALSVKPLKKYLYLYFAKGFGLFKKCTFLSSNKEESLEIMRIFNNITTKEVPNIPINPLELSMKEEALSLEKVSKFLFVGRISPEKNPNSILKAFMKVKHICELNVCGLRIDNEYGKEFLELASKLPSNVTFNYLGDVAHQKMREVYDNNHVMILPSKGENFGHAIFESISYGLPVIIGNNTPWKKIESKHVGIEVVPSSINEITNAVNRFIEMDKSVYAQWSNSAQEYAKSYYSSNNFEQIYIELFS